MNLPFLSKQKGSPRLRVIACRAGLICGLVLLAGCRTGTEQKWLSFFFDGVPQPGAAKADARTSATILVKPTVVTNTATITLKVFPHPPYAKRDCTVCHESQFSNRMRGQRGEICFTCHTVLHTNFVAAKVKHQPVDEGDCTSCHNPHVSANTKLLQKTVPALCLYCHDNFLEKAKFQHDVVEDCAGCHKPHQASEPGLLAKNILKLCGDCHEDKDLKAVKAHAGAEGRSCVACHDPHVGKDKFLLKAGAAGKEADAAK